MRIREIAQARPRFGYVRIWIMLRREGWPDNKKRIHRLYRLEGLQVRMRARRKKRLSLHRGVVPPASGRNQAWSMDFVHDQLVTGRAFRVLTVIDQWSRESVLMEANVALTGQSVVDALEALSARRPLPKAITVDQGSFNGRLRDECLNVYSFESVAHAQAVITAWRDDYNHRRPHGALGHLTPSEYATLRQQPTSEAAPL
jgi:putative transposase